MGSKDEYESKVCKNYFLTKRIVDLGITNNYIGYYYLVDILDRLINDSKSFRSISKEIYPMLAKKYNKKLCTIERDIRNVRDRKWESCLSIKLSKFWEGRRKPTCSKLIYLIKNYILEDLI